MKESTFFHRYKEMLLGIFMIALAAFCLIASQYIRTRSNITVNARMIPQLLGLIVIVLGILQVLAGFKYLAAARAQDEAEGATAVAVGKEEKRDAIPVVYTFIIILLYAVLFEPLGFVISSTLCMFAQMCVMSPKAVFHAGKFFAISLITAVVVYIVFKKGLDLSLPSGVLEGLGF
ncbi:MAG: tripartite tricarboxylate transporter TctB family protein [Planctomycetota bacterium]|jgi:putative tricarboxylic transport membrane protein|nr:tripartite tricarboxylate transporter TctB family protein [Planctomycetota bacterium]